MKLRHVTEIRFREATGGWLCELEGREHRGDGSGMGYREVRGYGPDGRKGRGRLPYRLAKSPVGMALSLINAWRMATKQGQEKGE